MAKTSATVGLPRELDEPPSEVEPHSPRPVRVVLALNLEAPRKRQSAECNGHRSSFSFWFTYRSSAERITSESDSPRDSAKRRASATSSAEALNAWTGSCPLRRVINRTPRAA
jgi:hypothetical protein